MAWKRQIISNHPSPPLGECPRPPSSLVMNQHTDITALWKPFLNANPVIWKSWVRFHCGHHFLCLSMSGIVDAFALMVLAVALNGQRIVWVVFIAMCRSHGLLTRTGDSDSKCTEGDPLQLMLNRYVESVKKTDSKDDEAECLQTSQISPKSTFLLAKYLLHINGTTTYSYVRRLTPWTLR